MKLKKKLLIGTALVLGFGPAAIVSAQGWQARTVDQVAADIHVDEQNKVAYTVKYGDTLGVISKALGVDLIYLAEINHIDNVDLIFPGTVIVAQYDNYHHVDQLAIQSPEGEQVDVDVPVNLASEPAGSETVVDFTNQTSEATEETEMVSPVAPAQDFKQTTDPVVEETTTTHEEVDQAEGPAVSPQTNAGADSVQVEPKDKPVAESQDQLAPAAETTQEAEPQVSNGAELPEVSNGAELPPVSSGAELPQATTEASSTTVDPTTTTEIIEPTTTTVELVEPTTTTAEIVEPTTTTAEVVEPTTTTVQVVERPADGLQPHVASYRDKIASQYGITNFSGYRPGDPGDHGKGLAIDFMVPHSSEVGDQIAAQAIADMKAGNQRITYVIWKQRISGSWTGYNWKPQEDRGNPTANHFDHVHVSFN
ncbi:LysM peptidoglycan-binding domain-containing protein [Facklamia languida]